LAESDKAMKEMPEPKPAGNALGDIPKVN
jgi:hypothetical protein